MSFIDRPRYPALYGPTAGDRIRLADTDLFIEVTEDHCVGGDEVVFGGGKVIRESMGQSPRPRAEGAPDLVITGRRGPRPLGRRQGRRRHPRRPDRGLGKAGNPDTMDGVHPELVIGPSTEVMSGNGRILTAGAIDCHVHLICPQQIDEALGTGHHHDHRRRHRPGRGHEGHHRHPAPGTWPGCWRRSTPGRSTSRCSARATPSTSGAVGAARARRRRVQAARGLGLDAGGDRRLPAGGRRVRRAGGDPHRHPQRGRLRRVHPGRDRRAGDPRVPHRGRRRRARAGHHHGGVAPERAAVVDEPDPAAHREHPRRAPRHADGLPPPQPVGAGGPGVRREPDPAVDDRRRGPAARPRRDLDDRLRLAGDGPRRRGRPAHLADRARHEGAPRRARGRRRRRQPAGPALRRQVHDLPGDRARAGARGRLGRGRQARRPGAVGPGVLRRAAARGDQGRDDRLGGDGRRQRLDPHAAAGAAAADVRRGGDAPRGARCLGRPRPPSRAGWPPGCGSIGGWSRSPTPGGSPSATCRTTTRCRASGSTPTRSRSASTARCPEQPAEVLPMAQRYFLF